MTATTAADARAVRAAVDDVRDPELPAVTIGMLGIVESVTIDAVGCVTVTLLPTFAGCPAVEMMERDVVAAVDAVPGVTATQVRFVYDPPWSTDRITVAGRAALTEFGIAPPGAWTNPVVAPARGRGLPLSVARPAVACPYCGSTETTEDSPFGPTPCRAVHHCASCRQPFEAFKPL